VRRAGLAGSRLASSGIAAVPQEGTRTMQTALIPENKDNDVVPAKKEEKGAIGIALLVWLLGGGLGLALLVFLLAKVF
jgi:hypothetical protein